MQLCCVQHGHLLLKQGLTCVGHEFKKLENSFLLPEYDVPVFTLLDKRFFPF
jgi:hypothetical protein